MGLAAYFVKVGVFVVGCGVGVFVGWGVMVIVVVVVSPAGPCGPVSPFGPCAPSAPSFPFSGGVVSGCCSIAVALRVRAINAMV